MRGSILRRVKSSWQLRYDGPPPPDAAGKRHQINETVRGTRKEAERILRERLQALESGNYIAKTREAVSQFMESWLDGYAATHTTPQTLMGYHGSVSWYIVPCLGQVRMQALTQQHVQDFHK